MRASTDVMKKLVLCDQKVVIVVKTVSLQSKNKAAYDRRSHSTLAKRGTLVILGRPL